MLRSHSLFFLAVLLPALGRPALAASVSYGTRSAAGVTAHVITVELNDPKVKLSVTVPKLFPGGDESFTSMVKRSGAVAAINGTFFSKGSLLPIGDIVSDGTLLYEGRMATAMAVTPKNKVLFGRVVWGHSADWTGYETVLECGPTLLKQGKVDLKLEQEGFHDPHVLGAANRSAVGLTADNHLLLVCVTSGVTLSKLAQMMKALGCVEAMNLDGGASMAMYYRGRVVLPAGRNLTNILVVSENGKHADLPEPLCEPEGNGAKPLSATAPRPLGLPGVGIGVAPTKPPEWFPEYPGARFRSEPDGFLAQFTTSDPVRQVAAFYGDRLGKRANVQTTEIEGTQIGLVQLRSDPGDGTVIDIEREKGTDTTRVAVLFGQPGRPKLPFRTLPKPVPASSYKQDMAECPVNLARPPAGVPLYPGTKITPWPKGVQSDTTFYSAPAGFQKVVAWYRAQLGDRARVTIEPYTKAMAAVRVLSGPGAGTLISISAGSPRLSGLVFTKEAPRPASAP